MSEWILQSLTNNIIFGMKEKENLKKIARKITKTPDSFHIPIEYLVKKERVG